MLNDGESQKGSHPESNRNDRWKMAAEKDLQGSGETEKENSPLSDTAERSVAEKCNGSAYGTTAPPRNFSSGESALLCFGNDAEKAGEKFQILGNTRTEAWQESRKENGHQKVCQQERLSNSHASNSVNASDRSLDGSESGGGTIIMPTSSGDCVSRSHSGSDNPSLVEASVVSSRQDPATAATGSLQKSHPRDAISDKDENSIARELEAKPLDSQSQHTRLLLPKFDLYSLTKDSLDQLQSEVDPENSLRPMAKILQDIGLGLVCEQVCCDLMRKRVDDQTSDAKKELTTLRSARRLLADKNVSFTIRLRRCKCGFQSESQNVHVLHQQFGSSLRNNGITCCLCKFITKIPGYFVSHMKKQHKLKGLIGVKTAPFQCDFCPFEGNHHYRVAIHMVKCSKLFIPSINLCPFRIDCDIPIFEHPKSAIMEGARPMLSSTSSGPTAGSVLSHLNKPPQMSLSFRPQMQSQVSQPVAFFSSAALPLPQACTILSPPATQVSPLTFLPVLKPAGQPHLLPNLHAPTSAMKRSVPVRLLLQAVAGGSKSQTPSTVHTLPAPTAQPAAQTSVFANSLVEPVAQTRSIVPPRLGQEHLQQQLHHSLITSSEHILPQAQIAVPSSVSQNVFQTRFSPPACLPIAPNPGLPMSTMTRSQETRFVQFGSQVCTFLQNPLSSFTVLPQPVRPIAPSFTLKLGPTGTTSGAFSSLAQSRPTVLPSNVSSAIFQGNVQSDKAGFVAMPGLQKTCDVKLAYNSLKICEICDGFVKDRKTLAAHFQTVHREFPGDPTCTIASLPCSMCVQAFFTISGLLRHYRLVHLNDSRLVQPLGYCMLCDKANLSDTVEHMSSSHQDVVFKSRELKQCGICSVQFSDVLSFERHMLVVHCILFPNRNILLATVAASLPKNTQLVTKSAQPKVLGKSTTPEGVHRCKTCGDILPTTEELNKHVTTTHLRFCGRCPKVFFNSAALQRHFHDKHASERDPCPLCLELVTVGRPFVRHVKRQHLKPCSVKIERMKALDLDEFKAVLETMPRLYTSSKRRRKRYSSASDVATEVENETAGSSSFCKKRKLAI